MKTITRYFSIVVIFCCSWLSPPFGSSMNRALDSSGRETIWEVSPSFKFDVLCFLNTLTGDPFYLKYYKDDYEKFEPKLTPEVRTSLAHLKAKIKDENKGIISASLAVNFSVTNDVTLKDMLHTIDHSEKMQDGLKKTPYYSDENWKLYESVRPDLKKIFQFLIKIKFYQYWKENVLPKIEKRVTEVRSEVLKYPVISAVEQRLGYALPSNHITIYLLNYNKPHGIKVSGTRFLTGEAWDIKIVVRNAIHEMMHPPWVDLKNDKPLSDALDSLKQDEFIREKVMHHDQSFGYNTAEGLIEEDTVQAIEQTINEELKVETEAHKRWKESDQGIHVFAVALYQVMREEKFPHEQESLRSFLLRMINSGKLGPGRIKAIHEAFYTSVPSS